MTGIRAGRMKDRVLIQINSGSADGFGQPTENWTTSATRSCSIEPLNGREYYAAQGEQTALNVRIRFRYEAGLISTTRRLVDNRTSPQRIFDIENVIDPGNEHRELIAMCVLRG